jgi:hypothetical protein
MLPLLMEWPKLSTESKIEKNCRAVMMEAKATAPEDRHALASACALVCAIVYGRRVRETEFLDGGVDEELSDRREDGHDEGLAQTQRVAEEEGRRLRVACGVTIKSDRWIQCARVHLEESAVEEEHRQDLRSRYTCARCIMRG